MESYKYAPVAEKLYEFVWHELADKYIEKSKDRLRNNDYSALYTLFYTYRSCLVMLHPFMPFITEEINSQLLGKKGSPLINTKWPV